MPLNARRVYDGSLFQVHQWTETGFDGQPYLFEKVTRPDAVVVVPVVDDQIVLAWERQPGRKPALGFLGGRVEPGESIHTAARRELAEEAGWTAETWEHWESLRPSGKMDWAVHLFSARGVHPAWGTRQPDECIQLRYYDLDGFVKAVAAPDFGNPVATLPFLRVLALPGGHSALASRLFGGKHPH